MFDINKELVPSLLIIAIVIMIGVSNIFNLGAFLSNGGGLSELCFSLVYVLLWSVLLIWTLKVKSLLLLNFYLIFWGIEFLYFALYMFALETPYLSMTFFIGVFIFFMPLIGLYMPFSIVEDFLKIDFLYDIIIWPFLIVSAIMIVMGLIARKRIS